MARRPVGSALGAVALGVALVGARFPRILAWPLAAVSAAGGLLSVRRSLRPIPSRSDEPADESADVASDPGPAPYYRRDPGS